MPLLSAYPPGSSPYLLFVRRALYLQLPRTLAVERKHCARRLLGRGGFWRIDQAVSSIILHVLTSAWCIHLVSGILYIKRWVPHKIDVAPHTNPLAIFSVSSLNCSPGYHFYTSSAIHIDLIRLIDSISSIISYPICASTATNLYKNACAVWRTPARELRSLRRIQGQVFKRPAYLRQVRRKRHDLRVPRYKKDWPQGTPSQGAEPRRI